MFLIKLLTEDVRIFFSTAKDLACKYPDELQTWQNCKACKGEGDGNFPYSLDNQRLELMTYAIARDPQIL